jgi:CHAT domain-containing protein
LFPGDRCTVLSGAQSTRDAVLEHLDRHRWAHFSCHGTQDLTDPSHGGLLLHDGALLTIADISARQYQGDFAFLSACKTATGGVTLPDEAITLAAALHFTGYQHVIATLWSVWDEYAAEVTESVYTTLATDGALDATHAAHAVHRAVRDLRDKHPTKPSIWTPFAHTGP